MSEMNRSTLPASAAKALEAFEEAVDEVVRNARTDGRSLVVQQDGEVRWVPAADIPLREERNETAKA